jgi:hypothetical protein
VLGGEDFPFSNNGPLSGITHTAGTRTITVSTAGTYLINYQVSIIGGMSAQMAITINGVVNNSTRVPFLVDTGNVSGTAIVALAAGDVITLRNNSIIGATVALAPSVGTQLTLVNLTNSGSGSIGATGPTGATGATGP